VKKRLVLIPVVILKTRTGYSAFSPVVEGCAATDKTIDRTLNRMKESLEFHLEGLTLVKATKKIPPAKVLTKSFADYGTDAFYATVKVAA
jgi:predicted RNase H-like HicB family nuclease